MWCPAWTGWITAIVPSLAITSSIGITASAPAGIAPPVAIAVAVRSVWVCVPASA
jgi:hypothetical protein